MINVGNVKQVLEEQARISWYTYESFAAWFDALKHHHLTYFLRHNTNDGKLNMVKQ